jgi:RING finger protein 121
MVYKVSYFVGIVGYIIMMATFMGLYLFFGTKPHVWMDLGLLLMFYALYYGVMARDLAEICAEKMATGIGYYKPSGIPSRQLEGDMCSLCGNKILVKVGEEGVVENTYRLTCGHE